jgi:aldehyde dehydrogenase (NAD+)
VLREPAGVVAAITPWNFPNQINLAKLGPALAAGCTVVLKPAPDTPWTGAELGRIIATRTDIPAGVVNVITSSRASAGRALTADPRVDMISFTGSTATGRDVMTAASATLKKVFLELGGKSAAIVLDDYDVAAAAALTAFSVCVHAGQGCALTTRLIVPRHTYDTAVARAAEVMTSLPAGDPQDPGTICGPVISAAQRERVESYLRSAREDGGTFACGGGRIPGRDAGFWIAPTVIAGLGNDAKAAREEIFGPVLVVLAHDGDDDAVRIANDSPYGLSGAVFGTDLARARGVAARVRTGTVGINGGVWYSPDVPFGGRKQSGMGREMGLAGFEEYLEIKSIAEPA